MGSRLLGRLAGITIFLVSFVAANAGHDLRGSINASAGTPAPPISEAAAKSAQADFPVIFARMANSANATIQISVPQPRGTEQLVWVTPMGRHQAGFLGQISSSNMLPEGPLAQGDVVRFETPQVMDWHYAAADGTLYGNFAIRERLASLAPADAARVRLLLSETPFPQSWF